MPSRADVEPAEMKPWLSRVMLIDVIDGGRDFRYRLVGTDIASRLGFDATGTNLSALPQAPEHVAKFLEEHQAVVRSVRPGYAVHDYYSTNINRLIRFERLLLPLGEHDDEVTMLLGLRNDLIERRPGDRP